MDKYAMDVRGGSAIIFNKETYRTVWSALDVQYKSHDDMYYACVSMLNKLNKDK